MSQIIITDISFSYKTFYEPIFEKITLNLDTDWRLGLIGRNGRGKTPIFYWMSLPIIWTFRGKRM